VARPARNAINDRGGDDLHAHRCIA
jgi:hypothetical protein